MILRPTPLPAPARLAACLPAAALLALATPLGAQETPGSFELPPASPAPTPAPAGPADERGGIAIPPRAQPAASPSAAPSPSPVPDRAPLVLPPPPARESAPAARASAPSAPSSAATFPAATLPGTGAPEAPSPAASGAAPPLASAPAGAGGAPAAPADAFPPAALPDWWPYAAGGLGALVLLGGGALAWRRRRKARPLRLAAPAAGAARDSEAGSAPAPDLPRLDLTLEITAATRSLMMFTLEYRLAIANRSERAVNDLALALQLACARASGAGNAPSAGSAQALQSIARIGPHQARSITGTVQLPLAAIAPLRQGTTPLFVPLVHVTLEGEGQRPLARSFVVGTPSASGRVHPIPLDVPPGALAGLVAQAIALPPASAAA
jgi:hypothetical protein